MSKHLKISLLAIIFSSACSSLGQGSWTQKSSLPAEGRHRATGFSIGNKGYIGLGHYNSGPDGNVVKADIWEYDPGSESWTQKADYGYGGTYGATAFAIGQYAYVGAHVYGGEQFYKFDPIGNTWTLVALSPISESERCSFAIGDYGYVMNSSTVMRYDSNTDSWTDMGPTPTSVGSWSTAFNIGDKGYLLSQNSFYEYKVNTNSWTWRASFPGEGIGGRVGFSINGKGYVCGGYIQFLSPTTNQMWEFDPLTNSWNQHQELPGATRRFASSFSIGNKGYVSTGTNGTNMSDLWEFDPLLSSTTENQIDLIRLYPNPFIQELTITLNSELLISSAITIFDVSGKALETFTISNVETKIDFSHYKAGTYFCSLTNANGLISIQKIIKQ